jgi:preprotein translocase subunit SecB
MNEKTPAESTNGNGGAGAPNSKNFLLQQIYIKDLSFESPAVPQSFQGSRVEPETELSIRNEHTRLDDNRYEVKLHIGVHTKQGDNTMFLAEVDQAGLFHISGYTEEETSMLLGTHCPSTLFPYARETIASLVGKGGFPPLVLQPISFDALYARAREQQSA